MNAIEITPVNVDSLKDNEQLYNDFLESGGTTWNRDAMEILVDDYLTNNHVLLLCRENAIFVGFALLSLRDRSCDKPNACVRCDESEKCLYIELLGIHPSKRGQGKLRPFLEQIKRFAVRRNYTCMRLTALNSKVAELYEDHAFSFEVPENQKICNSMKKSTAEFGKSRHPMLRRRRRYT